MRVWNKMPELLVECNSYRTVDENELPLIDNHDGLDNFEIVSYCCDIAKKFDDEYNTEIHFDTHVYPQLIPGNMKNGIMALRIKTGEYDDEHDIQVEKCPWCNTIPTIKIVKHIKRIRTCKEEIIPAKRIQSCQVTQIEE